MKQIRVEIMHYPYFAYFLPSSNAGTYTKPWLPLTYRSEPAEVIFTNKGPVIVDPLLAMGLKLIVSECDNLLVLRKALLALPVSNSDREGVFLWLYEIITFI